MGHSDSPADRQAYRDLALFNLAIDSKLRACDLLKLRVSNVSNGGRVVSRARVVQQKTRQAVQFEITAHTRDAICEWIRRANLNASVFSSQAGCTARHTSPLGNMPASSNRGWRPLVWIRWSMAPTLCAEPRHRWFTARPRISERYSFYLGTPSSKVRFAIWGLK